MQRNKIPLQSKKWNLHRDKLMVPGPVEVDVAVLHEMGLQIIPHFGKEWADVYKNTVGRIANIFQTKGDVFLLVSSGTGGIEAAIRSLFAPNENIIVISNGFFGDRIITISRSLGLNVEPLIFPWNQPADPYKVRCLFEKKNKYSGIVAVHHETSTGVLNPIREIGMVAKEFNIPFIVDAVSSIGCEEFRMDNWGIDIGVTVSNKCLEALPGITPVAVSKHAWDIMDGKENSYAGWYLNLQVWRQYAIEWSSWHPFPVTIPTNLVLALDAAMDLLEAEGVCARNSRYKDAALFLRNEIKKLGFSLFVDGEFASSAISVIIGRSDINIENLIYFLHMKHGIRIVGGLGELSGKVFRVAHMGKTSSESYNLSLLEGIIDYMRRNKST
jgi:alanine-glyoxylate transaminase/serine-glyoxylate transaminase/serine-pyruvate transaminase